MTKKSTKVIEVGKRKKNTFFIQSSLYPLFCEKVIVLTAPALSCRCCGKFYIGFSIFSRCWTTLPIWRVSNIVDLQHVHMFIINPIKPRANTKLGIEIEHVNILKIQNIWNLLDAFAVILPQQNQFWFLLMLKTSLAEVRQKTN